MACWWSDSLSLVDGMSASQARSRLVFGPLRNRRVAVPTWLALWSLTLGEVGVRAVVVTAVCSFIGARGLMMGVSRKGQKLVIRNVLRTRVLGISDVTTVGFDRYGLSGTVERLTFASADGKRSAANGVSVWHYPLLLPFQRPYRYRERVQSFLQDAGLDHRFAK